MAITSTTDTLKTLVRGIAHNDPSRYESDNPLRKVVLETQNASRHIEENASENRSDRYTPSNRDATGAYQQQGQTRTETLRTDQTTQERLSTRANNLTAGISAAKTASRGALSASGLTAGYTKPDTTAVSRPTLLTNALSEPRTATLRTNPLASEKRVSTASVESTTKPSDIRERAIAAYRTSQDRRTERLERSA